MVRILVAWAVFLAAILVGAGLLTSADGQRQNVGLVLILASVLFLGLLTLLFYVQNRRRRRHAPAYVKQ